MPWKSVLERVLAIANSALASDETRWALIGSAASALQGCSITPRDIDILAREPAGVHHLVALMSSHAPAQCPHPVDHPDWCSSQELPLNVGPDEYGFYWHFARWLVDGIKVEAAHIVAPEGFPTSEEGAGIWEAGPEIWSHLRQVTFAGYQVPVVPLEIQLGTSLQRGMEERAAEIAAVLGRHGFDEDLLKQGLSQAHLPELENLLAKGAAWQSASGSAPLEREGNQT